ncbi:MAG: hypothetical protein HKM86_02615 [Deltaproteobacteria bacterium]|nr:hypothetical protein [Deltaproteobacteria bacterium]
MPEFFQGLREHRGSNATARQCIESAWSRHHGTERIRSPFVWSTQLIKDVRNLDFGASDIACQWNMRGRGLSCCALGPAELFLSGKCVQTADDWRLFEQSEGDGTLTLAERRSNQKSSELVNSTPEDQMTTVCHLEAVADRHCFLFTENCPVVTYLLWCAQKLSGDPSVASWDKNHWRALNWHVHVALRKVWTDCDNGIAKEQLAYMTRIQADLTSGRKFSIADCPAELRDRKRSATAAGLPGAEKRAPQEKSPKDTPPAPPRRSPIADNFDALIQKAKEGSKKKAGFATGRFLSKATDCNYVFGDKFRQLANGNPCGRFFTSRCGTPKCHHAHELRADPDRATIDGMVKRFGEKVDAHLAAEASKE